MACRSDVTCATWSSETVHKNVGGSGGGKILQICNIFLVGAAGFGTLRGSRKTRRDFKATGPNAEIRAYVLELLILRGFREHIYLARGRHIPHLHRLVGQESMIALVRGGP
eukprot:scaffold60638_cov40-Attheya_sp.AAC.1